MAPPCDPMCGCLAIDKGTKLCAALKALIDLLTLPFIGYLIFLQIINYVMEGNTPQQAIYKEKGLKKDAGYVGNMIMSTILFLLQVAGVIEAVLVFFFVGKRPSRRLMILDYGISMCGVCVVMYGLVSHLIFPFYGVYFIPVAFGAGGFSCYAAWVLHVCAVKEIAEEKAEVPEWRLKTKLADESAEERGPKWAKPPTREESMASGVGGPPPGGPRGGGPGRGQGPPPSGPQGGQGWGQPPPGNQQGGSGWGQQSQMNVQGGPGWGQQLPPGNQQGWGQQPPGNQQGAGWGQQPQGYQQGGPSWGQPPPGGNQQGPSWGQGPPQGGQGPPQGGQQGGPGWGQGPPGNPQGGSGWGQQNYQQ